MRYLSIDDFIFPGVLALIEFVIGFVDPFVDGFSGRIICNAGRYCNLDMVISENKIFIFDIFP